jgi:glycosyltransferase involved in cell wall biosynthesis
VAGVSRYISGLLGGLAESCPAEHEYFVFVPKGHGSLSALLASPQWRVIETGLAPTGTGLRIACEHLLLWSLLRKHRIDVYHALNNVVPMICPCASVVTVHDLSFITIPQVHTTAKRIYWNRAVRDSVRSARRIIAISEATADDLVSVLGVSRSRIIVAPHGASVFPPPDNAWDQGLPCGLEPQRFILFVGTLEPRKNLVKLVQAYEELRAAGHTDHKLVLVGKKGWHSEGLENAIKSSRFIDDIIVPGFIADADLGRLYQAASVFVYPSLLEGFGLPVLEALSRGVPTVTSNISAMREVAGDAAVQVDPADSHSIAVGIGNVLADPQLAKRLRAAGPTRAKLFTWRRAAGATLEAYRQCAA